MTYGQAIILGIVQGVTEFVPVSSSGHLVIIPQILGWQQPSLAFDVLLHLGTLMAAIMYFRSDLAEIISGLIHYRDPSKEPMKKLGLLLACATIVTLMIALLIKDRAEAVFAKPVWVAAFLIVTSFILFAGEKLGRQEKTIEKLNLTDSIWIGVAQGMAIFPGISRSGATIAAGLCRRVNRDDSARFSFILAIPIILAAVAVEVPSLLGGQAGGGPELIAGFMASVVSGYMAIHYLVGFLKKRSLNVFALYCLIAGTVALLFVF